MFPVSAIRFPHSALRFRRMSSRQSKFSSSRILKSGWREHLLSKIVQQGDNLLAFHAGKPLQKFIDRCASFQVIEKALDRHARAHENRFTSENLGIRMITLFHS